MSQSAPPPCPACEEQMRLSRVLPGVAGHPALHSFECNACGEVLTTEAPPPEPAN